MVKLHIHRERSIESLLREHKGIILKVCAMYCRRSSGPRGGAMCEAQLMNPTFDLDGEGNIYLTRQVYDGVGDSTSVEAGTFTGVRFWVDGHCVGTTMVGSGHHWRQEQQVLKFAPHFDTLLAARCHCPARQHALSHHAVV